MKTVITLLLFGGLQLAAQDMQSCPMHKEQMKNSSQHLAYVEKHGDQAMGFPHDKTTHHFRLYSDGGAIEVTANDGKDTENIQAIRSHLAHIVRLFSDGDFSIPMFVHDQVLRDWVFASPDLNGKMPRSYTCFYEKLGRACQDAGIKHVSAHSFRHSYRAWLDELGTPISVQQRAMRHGDIRVTMNVYGDPVNDALRDASSKVAERAISQLLTKSVS